MHGLLLSLQRSFLYMMPFLEQIPLIFKPIPTGKNDIAVFIQSSGIS